MLIVEHRYFKIHLLWLNPIGLAQKITPILLGNIWNFSSNSKQKSTRMLRLLQFSRICKMLDFCTIFAWIFQRLKNPNRGYRGFLSEVGWKWIWRLEIEENVVRFKTTNLLFQTLLELSNFCGLLWSFLICFVKFLRKGRSISIRVK